MRTTSITIALIILCTFLSSCYKETIRASGEITREQVNFTGYTGLRVSNAFNVYVNFSDTEENITVEANEDIQHYIVVEKDGNDLVVRLKRFTNIRGNATLNVYITTKNINYFDISGASNISLESNLVASSAVLDLSGASNFSGEVTVDRLDLESHGASNIDLYGQVGQMDVALSGSSELRNFDLSVQRLDIELSGASDAFLSVITSIDIDASGASSLTYQGDAVINSKRMSGASQLIKRE